MAWTGFLLVDDRRAVAERRVSAQGMVETLHVAEAGRARRCLLVRGGEPTPCAPSSRPADDCTQRETRCLCSRHGPGR